ncbi:MAG: prevent-host-death protein [Geobacteraceae bacterium GWC2_58_44]|nr:MAG: prevent-host-death protein [Geobacteraceae bacterium GWC2_58_44]HBG06707.1 type II toxin-antitoxin system prevent-host-death family antitoxin [Geobacter sp.]
MIEVNVTEFRNHLPDYLGRVKRGEEVLLTSRGKVVARMSPVTDERVPAREMLASLRSKCKIGDVMAPVDEVWEVDDVYP